MKERLDIHLARRHRISRAHAVRIINGGHAVGQNGRPLKPSCQLTAEEFKQVSSTLPPARPDTLQPEDIPLEIVYEDSHLLVVRKPAGLVVHPGAGNRSGTLVHALLHHCSDLSGIGGVERPGIVHRIDKDTDGLLVVAKNDRAHQRLSDQFAVHSVQRHYRALVSGRVVPAAGTVDAPIGRHPRDRQRFAVVTRGGRRAVTRYRVLAYSENDSLLDVTLETGRTHQIRVHMTHIGNPLVGDPVYGRRHGSGQYLIAYRLGFIHPVSEESMVFTMDLPGWARGPDRES